MTDICLLGARNIAELTTIHHELGKMLDPRKAVTLKRDLQFPIKAESKSGTWIYMTTAAPLTTTNPARETVLSFMVSNMISNLIPKQHIVFAMIRIRNMESEDQAIARVFQKGPNLDILGLVELRPIIIDEYYANA
jgi:hypothetical protein